MQNYWLSLIGMIINSSIALGLLYAVKWLDDRRTSFDEDELIVKNCNLAIGLRKIGLYVGMAIGLYGVIHGPGKNLFFDALNVIWESVFLIAAMYVAYLVNEHVLLRKVDNDEAVKSNNIAVGFVEMGSYLSTGMIVNSAFSGEGGGVIPAIVFFLLGQIALILIFKIFQLLVYHAIGEEIEEKGNVSAGLSVCGTLVSISIILRASIAGPFTGWQSDIMSFGFSLFAGMALLGIYGAIVTRIFLPKTTFVKEMRDAKNLASVAVISGIQIALALVIASSI